jgi:hypothetical protein
VADPNTGDVPRSRRVKTDRRDAARWLTHVSMEITARLIADPHAQRIVQSMLNVRRELTDSRTRDLNRPRDHPRRGFRNPGSRTNLSR